MNIKELEDFVFTTSVCYSDSVAFRKSLEFVKNNNSELYEELLKQEVSDMGY